MSLADYDPDTAERIQRGTVRQWMMLMEHRIDEIVKAEKQASIGRDNS